MHYIVTAVNSSMLYKRCVYENAALRSPVVKKLPFNNVGFKKIVPLLFNMFLDNPPPDLDGWIIFCPDYLEFLKNPFPRLERADPDTLYGLYGAKLTANLKHELFVEGIGRVTLASPASAGELALGDFFPDASDVDSVDGRALMLHSDLAKKQGARFDSRMNALCFEDFCLNAADKYKTRARVLRLDCRLYELDQMAVDPGKTPDRINEDLARCRGKYQEGPPRATTRGVVGSTWGREVHKIPQRMEIAADPAAWVQEGPVHPEDYNHPAVLAAHFMKRESSILDFYCAAGDNALFFKEKLGAKVWGFEHTATRLEKARARGFFENILPFDPEKFYPSDFPEFYSFFDHIHCAQGLERFKDPSGMLLKLKSLLNPSGTIITSLPNIAHAHVILSLLNNSLVWQKSGILNESQLHFFAMNGMAALYAEAGLEIKAAMPAFLIPDSNLFTRIPITLPGKVFEFLASDPHFMACQYVAELQPAAGANNSGNGRVELARRNLAVLEESILNNTKGFQQKAFSWNRFVLIQELYKRADYPPRFKSVVLEHWENGEKRMAILFSRLFDQEWYAFHNPDLENSGINKSELLDHYLYHGWREGRDPSPFFSTNAYLRDNPDAADAGMCPLVHYLAHGIQEGRTRRTV